MFKSRIKAGSALALALCGGLAACGDTVGEQALYGGAAGAGASAIFNTDLLTGAAVGAAANLVYCQENPSRC
ncbi:hypothetical protein CVM52_17150 [Pseudooceanicola lipolyticus]|uniref:Lipoprotein n=1 Tax=Pseudooceanicola lipolyticus TaxID=2029104 RepID=A0A2M8IY26_9RHOB|nr:hypothetical protein [Pseudooceanicola lipolyticus]PJE35443.1 hypothetical protein CVM52_17150 [Pseudooceanicola lipolyticus]